MSFLGGKRLSVEAHRAALAFIAEQGGEYAGIPMRFEGDDIVIHPSYRFAEVYQRAEQQGPEEWKVRNTWQSLRHPECTISILENLRDGRIIGGMDSRTNPLTMAFKTFGAAGAWDVDAEKKAIGKLARLVRHHTFVHYMLTGAFLETSKRSGVTYMFRRLRPTLAIKADNKGVRALAALCLHPIGYYAESWAGVMVPTDEVVAHLLLMRGDEKLFWRLANQHSMTKPEAGL